MITPIAISDGLFLCLDLDEGKVKQVLNLLDDIMREGSIKKKANNDKEQQTDKERAAHDLEFFAKTYFPSIFSKNMCQFHHDMFRDAQSLILNYNLRNNQFVRAAPRGHGKSRIISVVFPLWIICYKYRRNIMLIADTGSQSKEYIATIKAELEDNERLRKDFGDLTGAAKWTEDEIITRNDIRVVAKSSGQSLRGSSYKNIRPEVVILDDLENDEQVETENQRRKLYNWFMKVLMPVGNDETVFLYVGTVLHYEALLYKVLTDSAFNDWNRKMYRAINEFNQSPLWGDWEEKYLDISNPNAAEDAHQFLVEHQDEMLKDVDVLWPEKYKNLLETYEKLMIFQLQDNDAFNSEYQNNPMTEESRIFKQEWLDQNYYTELPKMKEIYASVDLSMGKSRTSDTSAIIVMGRGVDNYLYVMEADVARRPPDEICKAIIEYVVKYGNDITGFVIETNVFQEFFAKTLKKECIDMGLYVNWIEEKSVGAKDSKDLRIRSLAPKIKNGYIKFNPAHKTLIKQLLNYPKDHDDAPDAMERCVTKFSSDMGSTFVTSLGKRQRAFKESQLLRGFGF